MKDGHGKRHVFRFYWISAAFAMGGYVGLSFKFGRLLTWDEVKGLLGVALFVFLTTLPVSASFWIKRIGDILGVIKGKKEEVS